VQLEDLQQKNNKDSEVCPNGLTCKDLATGICFKEHFPVDEIPNI
jgi:hypothetical protein